MNGYYWLASYPKSGNTWLRMFLESLAAGGEAPNINSLSVSYGHAAQREEFDRLLDIESADLTDEEIMCVRPRMYELESQSTTAPLLRKVHDAWGITPADEPLFPVALTIGAIYIVRDPRDVAVSLAHHTNQTVDQAIARMGSHAAVMNNFKKRLPKQLPQILPSWSNHVESWLAAPIRRLVLRYEDMLVDPIASFGEAARFLGFETTTAVVAASVKAVRFEQLRKQEDVEGFLEAPPGMKRFFRRGIAGGWRDSLSPEQAARIEAEHGTMMRKLGYLPTPVMETKCKSADAS